jgi:hypothetical protein
MDVNHALGVAKVASLHSDGSQDFAAQVCAKANTQKFDIVDR